MVKKVTPKKEAEMTKESLPPKDYIELKLPRFPLSQKFAPILIGLGLLLLAFGLGYQTARVTFLEDQVQTLGSAGNQNLEATPIPGKVDVEIGNLPILGNKDAKVTIVEFSDFQCPFCKSFADGAFEQIKKEYIDTGKIAFAFRHLPLPNHPNAPLAAEAAECANEQDSFWKYHDVLFDSQTTWSPLTLEEAKLQFISYASEMGLNSTAFTSCLDSGTLKDSIAKDVADGQAANVSATPTIFINGQAVIGALPFDAFKTIIDQELAK